MGAKGNTNGFKKGAPSANPNGRPKGSKTKFSLAQAKTVAAEGITPLQFLLTIMRGDTASLRKINIGYKPCTEDRIRAATAAAPYCHRKMPIGIDNGRGGPVGAYTAEQLGKLSDKELDALSIILGKLAVIGSDDQSRVGATGASLGIAVQQSEDSADD